MQLIQDPFEMTSWSAAQRRQGLRIGFVPTMGALHAGHLDLVGRALAQFDVVATSIFVNPLQFNDPQDFSSYPLRPEEDRGLLEGAGCNVLFAPTQDLLFAHHHQKDYELGGLDSHWEGPQRPGHFQGVVNVVDRLFGCVRPDGACFGMKDRQQLAIIQWVTKNLRWPIDIIPCPTVREPDGLAMSSRNIKLSPSQRTAAPALYRALKAIEVNSNDMPLGECMHLGRLELDKEPGIRLEYLGIADAETMQPCAAWPDHGEVIAMIAAQLGTVRLIDNLTIRRG
ncbi:MAG: pantoate--beta-alanine ligase [Flavobacteriales bacterium]|nr:pantoate--beta-alanine ligase [Flavobacteriales bacterium]